MKSGLAVELESVSKKFCRDLRRSMLYGLKDIARNSVGLSSNSSVLRDKEFWAVKDVSLRVTEGESLGLIGPNGSGKTTVLKLMNGIFWPDTGRVSVRGKVGALIEVGAGFHPMLTGRENVFVNAAILGMSKVETEDRLDDIIEFADIGNFIDSPVKFYSSGMYVRLGFSVAVHCNPDILLVDEVLAVGDKSFTMKCYQKIHEIRRRGTTVVLVSHNVYAIREQTGRCLYMNHGEMRCLGVTEDAINMYLNDMNRQSLPARSERSLLGQFADKKAEILHLEFFDVFGKRVDCIESGSGLVLVVHLKVSSALTHPIVGVNFYGEGGFMYCANSHYEGHSLASTMSPGVYEVRVTIPCFHVPHSSYLCSVVVAEDGPDNLVDWHDMAYAFSVSRARNSRGSIKLPTEWEMAIVESES